MSERLVTPATFAFVSKLLRERCGILLEPGKEYLVKARLTPVAQKYHAENVDQLIERLQHGDSSAPFTDVVEAMLTTETLFFRDVQPFESLKNVILPGLIEGRRSQRQLNIWCAASSSGQEPYSVGILLNEFFPELQSWRIRLLATDVSQEMLQRARAGCYSQMEVDRGMPPLLLLKWFRREGGAWHIDDKLRSTVTFSQLNLALPWPAMPAWDLILLRNVMIYFDNDIKRAILERVARVLCKDGYLMLGGAETTLGLSDSFSRIEDPNAGFYQLKESG